MANHSSSLAWEIPQTEEPGGLQSKVSLRVGHDLETNTLSLQGFPKWLSGKESTCQVGDTSSIPELERSLGEGNGNPVQYSFLENPVDRGAWLATAHRTAQSQTQLKCNN